MFIRGRSKRVLWRAGSGISGTVITRGIVPPIVGCVGVVRRVIVRWVSFAADLARWGTRRVEGAGRINELVEVSKGYEGEYNAQD